MGPIVSCPSCPSCRLVFASSGLGPNDRRWSEDLDRHVAWRLEIVGHEPLKRLIPPTRFPEEPFVVVAVFCVNLRNLRNLRLPLDPRMNPDR